MTDEVREKVDRLNRSTIPESEAGLAAPAGSAPITAAVAKEMFDLFVRHGLSYEQCINAMVATTKMIGRKAANDEVGAFCMFLHKAMKICPELGDVGRSRTTS